MHYYFSQIILIIILFLLAAVFAASETALFSLKKSQIHRFSHSAKFSEKKVSDLMRNPSSILMTILAGNLLVHILLSSIVTSMFLIVSEKYGPFFAIASVTPVLVIFGEITPKVIALSNPELFSRILSYPMRLFHGLLYPIRLLFALFAKPFIALTGFNITQNLSITQEEIDIEIDESERKKLLTEDEADFIRNIMRFPEKEASNVMIPRNHAVFIQDTASIKDAAELFRDTGVVRVPVYKNNPDTIVGLIDVREIVPVSFDPIKRKKTISKYIRQIHFYPESKRISDLLNEFLTKRYQIAIIVDEFGGTAGIVTLSSLINEILGKDFSLSDVDHVSEINEIGKQRYIVDGDIQLDDFNVYFDEQLESSESDTLAGYIIEHAGHFPSRNSIIETDKVKIRVRSIRKNRIETCEVSVKGEKQ
jgi:putative hemolysin